ncbi:MAG: DUF2087 domain-containing protein [Saprospiraceae bacterium]|nr:DUF2087 domain-containing protein [Saprospiraceae bacterium]
MRGYFDQEGKISHFPGKRQKKKQALILEFLAEKFETGKSYSEIKVNEILNQFHSFKDPATLRRLMFGQKLLDRTLDGRKYWKVEKA